MSAPKKWSQLSATAKRQRGVVLLVIMLVTITFGGYFGVRALNATVARSGMSDHEVDQILAQSKSALLAWSITTDENLESLTGTVAPPLGVRAFRPGNLPYPDLATAASNAMPSDGYSDRGCARTTWIGIGTLRPVTDTTVLTAAQRTTLRCFGRLPIKTIGLGHLANGDTSDSPGRWPWYIVSANLVAINFFCPARLDSTITGSGLLTGVTNCGDDNTPTVPFPWITILDPLGRTVSTRGAAVIIVPGPVTTRQPGNLTQVRSATALPNAFLDTVENPLCPGGRCDNGSMNQSPGMTFIQCAKASTTVGDTNFSVNYACNDRLTYITIDELFSFVARRIERDFVRCLKEYEKNNPGKYPWAALPGSPSSVLAGTTSGSFPSNDDSAVATCSNQAGYWGGWQRAATYSVSADQSSASFTFPGRSQVNVP